MMGLWILWDGPCLAAREKSQKINNMLEQEKKSTIKICLDKIKLACFIVCAAIYLFLVCFFS
jgi:hypothetical protein